mmetsp:Transcript_876/g.3184  ORF Transcript_876/g.3184 Transcript_876/m.3184 type:complete len:127 (+) Transcript_876:2189-2569(+)
MSGITSTYRQTRGSSARAGPAKKEVAPKKEAAPAPKKRGTTDVEPKGGKKAKKEVYGSDVDEDFDPVEDVLRSFDLTSKYGPCKGISRMQRWARADKIGLEPPQDVKRLLETNDERYQKCIWEGRI